jgi:hypothetical protein
MRSGIISNADIDTIETVATIELANEEHLFLTFVVGAANLSSFEVAYRAHASGGWAVIATAAGDYTSPAGMVVDASGDLTVAASGATVHWLRLNVGGIDAVRIRAAGTSSTLTGHYQAR